MLSILYNGVVQVVKGRKPLIIVSLLIISACDTTRNNIFAPNKRVLTHYPKQADLYPDYKQGWLDGCESGLATGFANDYYKSFYKYQKDKNMVKKGVKPYLRAWSSAMIYCRHYATGTLKEAGMPTRLPGEGFPMPLGGDSGDGAKFGHGILKTWELNNHGAQGLGNW